MELKFGVISIKFGVWNAYDGLRIAQILEFTQKRNS